MLTAVVQFRGGLVINGDVTPKIRRNLLPPPVVEPPSSRKVLIEDTFELGSGVINRLDLPCNQYLPDRLYR